ncbi:hypothetical protein [Aeromonas simiae]|uniref:hypothetical protein n=1 Tax=Aeromonas simiae TaxID=218936 RepID=UPI00266B4E72|nr:hypothetical protein [Aeromonas simiae]MDO2950573.1 hypothetical protein [Aeromonas simiae]
MSRPIATPCQPRMEIAMKAVIRELAHELGLGDVVSVAHAAGIDKTALCLRQELEARSPKKPQHNA